MEQKLIAKNVNISDYPCIHMAHKSTLFCDNHHDVMDCPDVAVIRKSDGTFGIPIRDGGSSSYEIKYCPWCGMSLPSSNEG